MADNITISRGTGGRVHWPLYNEAGDPVTDFTGWTAKSQVRTHFSVVVDDPDTEEIESNLLHEFTYEFADNGIYLTYTETETNAWDFLFGCGDFKIWADGVPQTSPRRYYLWVRQSATA